MNGNSHITEQQAQKEREKFVTAFNDTMVKIWQEQITLLDVIDTGALLASPKGVPMRADGRFFRGGPLTSLPRIRLVAGLRHRSRNASWQLRRSRPCQKAQTPPLVLAQVLRFGHANQRVL